MNWYRGLKGGIKKKELLKKHTTFKIGGRADFFIIPRDAADLGFIVRQARINNINIRVIGAGSNILAGERAHRCVVISLESPYFKKIDIKGDKLEAGSGSSLSRVILYAQKNGLSGLEYFSGIPGRVGGALVMNAGARNKSIGALVERVSVMDHSGKIMVLKKRDLNFSYRDSNLDKYIILEAQFKLRRESRFGILKKMKGYFEERYASQEWRSPSAGCVFKNPYPDSAGRPAWPAGRLIEACGLKGRKVGGARVSLKHANFIINTGGAKADDVLRLMKLIKKRVKGKFNINLEPEIRIWQ